MIPAAWLQPNGREVLSILAKIGPNPPSPLRGERGARCSVRRKVNATPSARTFGAKHSRGLPPNRSVACQPHGGSLRAKRPCQRPTNTTPSARTFGAKHSRKLPPSRSAAWRQPYGLEVLWNPVNRWVKTREGEAPAERPNADPRCKRLPAILRSSGDRRSPRRRDAAQQELRPPGTPSCQKVKAIGLAPSIPASRSYKFPACSSGSFSRQSSKSRPTSTFRMPSPKPPPESDRSVNGYDFPANSAERSQNCSEKMGCSELLRERRVAERSKAECRKIRKTNLDWAYRLADNATADHYVCRSLNPHKGEPSIAEPCTRNPPERFGGRGGAKQGAFSTMSQTNSHSRRRQHPRLRMVATRKL